MLLAPFFCFRALLFFLRIPGFLKGPAFCVQCTSLFHISFLNESYYSKKKKNSLLPIKIYVCATEKVKPLSIKDFKLLLPQLVYHNFGWRLVFNLSNAHSFIGMLPPFFFLSILNLYDHYTIFDVVPISKLDYPQNQTPKIPIDWKNPIFTLSTINILNKEKITYHNKQFHLNKLQSFGRMHLKPIGEENYCKNAILMKRK